ncbi:MAG: MucBP domain-containing protein, partial [Clostridia bacterium]
PIVNEQSINKNGTEKIENLTDEITYDIVYKATLEDYIGEAEITIVDKLPYQIVVDSWDLAGGTYDATGKTITWTETIKGINSYENKNNEITINKTIKVVYTGINQGTTNIKNVVTGKIKTKTPEKEFDEVTANETTTTEFTVNIPVSKIWEDDSNKLGQRPTRVTFKLVGSDGSEYTKELAKPGTSGTTTTQDQSNPNKWNDIFTNLPKYDSNNQEIKYTLTEINGNLKYYDVTVDNTGKIVTNTNKYGKVTVHYYIMNTDGTTTTTRVPDANGKEIPDVVIEGKEGEEYHTTWANNVNEKYELVAEKLPANATGKIEKYNEEKPQEVIYYYRLKPAKVLINYLEKDSNQVLTAQEKIDGHVDDKYNTNTEHRKETLSYNGKMYTLVEDSGNTEGTMTVTDTKVTYYYLQNTKATVRYVARDPETHEIVKELEEPYTQEGLVGDKFVTNEKAFIGYKLVESPTNKTINMTKEEQTLIYYYEPVYTGLIENHIDDKTGRVLYTEEHQVQVGTEYNIPSKEFEGYDLVESKLPANAEGIMGEELVTVNYYYIKKAVLEVNYIDIYTNKPLTDKKVDNTKHEGDLYTTEQKEFENYDLVEVPSNASGTIAVETDEEGNITNNRTVVTYYYTQRAIVEEHHIDSLTGKDIEESKIHNGHVGDEYDIPSKEFLSYQLIEEDEEGNSMLPANSKGTMTEEKIVVNYYYNQPAKVIVHYVEKATGKELEETNTETGEVQSSQVTIEGFNQDEYTTEAKEFKYYTLIETELPTNAEGEMKVEIVEDEEENKTVNNTIDVYYYYEAKPFNIGVEKEITGIVVNGETRTPTNGKLERVEIYRKDVEKTNIQIVYRIRVINSGEVEGAVTIEDKLPEGMNLVNNDGTWEEQDGILRKIIPEINPGETKEYTVVLNWNTAENNMGEKDNVINIVDTQNVPGFIDNNDKDNTSNANVIISVGTGELPIGLILALVALVGLETVTLRYAVVLNKRQKRK